MNKKYIQNTIKKGTDGIKWSYELLRDIIDGYRIATYGSNGSKDDYFADKVGIYPKNREWKYDKYR